MLHDSLLSRTSSKDRRHGARQTVRAELVVRWHHDHGTPVRYPVVDLGEGGCRIRSGAPLLRGMSGTAIKLLPKGEELHRVCTVSWSRADGEGFEIGLKFV